MTITLVIAISLGTLLGLRFNVAILGAAIVAICLFGVASCDFNHNFGLLTLTVSLSLILVEVGYLAGAVVVTLLARKAPI